MKSLVSAVCSVFIFAVSAQSYAAFVSLDDSTFGADSITLDNSTGLEWLDISISNNQSFDYVSGQFGAGGIYEGFRYATKEEVDQLLTNLDFLVGYDNIYRETNFTPSQNLFFFLGSSYIDPNNYFEFISGTSSTTSLVSNPGNHTRVLVVACYTDVPSQCVASNEPSANGKTKLLVADMADNFAAPTLSNFIVREASVVPIPPALYLFGSGLFGLIGMSTRKKAA